jgi:flagellar basal body-associated protein FliL
MWVIGGAASAVAPVGNDTWYSTASSTPAVPGSETDQSALMGIIVFGVVFCIGIIFIVMRMRSSKEEKKPSSKKERKKKR